MTTTPPSSSAEAVESEMGSDLDEIEADIERTREQLGETVEALSRKFDMKARATQSVGHTKQRVKEQAIAAKQRGNHVVGQVTQTTRGRIGAVKPAVRLGIVAAVAALAVALVLRRQQQG
jgi:ABC-type enterochelin transport system substrate-binding protein